MKTGFHKAITYAKHNLRYKNEFKGEVDTYQVQEIFAPDQWEIEKKKLEQWGWSFSKNESIFASDGNGNFYTLQEGGVYFLNHETDEKILLINSLINFLKHLEEPEDLNITLKPEQVKSVWVDPDFKPEFD